MNYETEYKENTMSTTQTWILQAKRRARDYWSIDGLPTIFHALPWFILAGMLNIRRGAGVVVATVVVLCVWALGMFLTFRETAIIKRVKANFAIGSTLPQAAVPILMGVGSLVELRKNKLAWIDALGLVSAGLVIAFLPTSHYDRINLMFLTPGVVLTLRGTLTFLYYLRRNPVVQA